MDKNAFEKKYNTIGVNIFRTHQLFCQDVLKLSPGEMGIVSNGKVSRKTFAHSSQWHCGIGVSNIFLSQPMRWNTYRGWWSYARHMRQDSVEVNGTERVNLWHSIYYFIPSPIGENIYCKKENVLVGITFFVLI